MESLYLLIPMSAILVLALVWLFGWAVFGQQFEDLDREGERILRDEEPRTAGIPESRKSESL